MSLGYVYDDLMLLHHADGQLENPDRIVVVYNELNKRGYIDKMIKIPSKSITKEELKLAHGEKYIDNIYKMFELPNWGLEMAFSNMNSMFGNKQSITSAEVAAGSTLNLMKQIGNGSVKHGVAIVRPPGHHAHYSKGSGFCFFNNVVIAAKYVESLGFKVAIVDWDIHQNDGVVDILRTLNNPDNILAISIHRYDHGRYYPGTGKEENTKNILSIPLNKTAYDEDYYKIFDSIILPRLGQFNPDFIVVSAGFDAGKGDPLGGYQVTPNGYYNLTKRLLSFGKPMMLVLEGGYNLNTIAQSMAECTRALLENK